MEWWQLVIGALISGLIGVFIVLMTGRIRNTEWVRENIIRPLYNESDWIRVSQASQIDLSFKSFWSQLDSYSKLKVSKKFRNGEIANYIDALAHFQSALKRYDKLRWEMAYEDCVKRAIANYLTDDGNIWLSKSPAGEQGYTGNSISVKEFIAKYLPVLTSLRGGDSLAQALIKESERRNWRHEEYFRAWQSQRPTVFAELAREFRNIKMPQEHTDAQEELLRVRNELVLTADSLANQLFEESKNKL